MGVTNSGSVVFGGEGGAGKAAFHDLTIVHNMDGASPLLMKTCATGMHLKDATITQRKAGKRPAELPHHQDR
jgi:type VI secretion system secreted protein Hcp